MLRRLVSPFVWSVSVLGATATFWVIFGACVGCFGCAGDPVEPPEPINTIYASWDPLACGAPHRVVIDLVDDGGAPLSGTAPCNRGGVELAPEHWGRYAGHVYTWAETDGIARMSPPIHAEIAVDAPVVYWPITPPGAPR